MNKEEKKYYLEKKNESSEFDYIDQDGVSFNSPAEWLFTGVLGGCGCGSSEDFSEKAVRVLNLFGTPHENRTWYVYDNEVDELLAHWLDSKGLLEHGGSVAGSWLSEKGEQIHKSLAEHLSTKEV